MHFGRSQERYGGFDGPKKTLNIFQYINIHLDTFGIYRLDITFCMIKVYCYRCFVIFEVFQVHLQFYIVAYLGWRPWDSRKATRGRDLLASLNK